MTEFRELTDGAADLDFLARLYDELYVPEFPDEDERESLANMRAYLGLKAQGWYGPNNYHIIVLLDGGRPVGLSISDYFSEPKAGVIEFLVIADDARGGGFGAKLLAHTEAAFAQDAAGHGEALACIAAEMNDPFKAPLEDSLDPFVRAAVWGRWGYRRLDFPYVQPALSADQKPVENLLLMAKPVAPALESAFPAGIVKSILRNYMIWAMRIADPDSTPVYRAMAKHLDARESIPAALLDAYVGRDPAKPLHLRELAGPDDPDRAALLAVYRESFRGGATDVNPEEFARAAQEPGYHLWAIRRDEGAAVEGMASFFSFDCAGFGGYVALTGSLKRTGRFGLVLSRMEEQMRRDVPDARGLYIECDPAKEAFFRRFGFFKVDLVYRQPPLPGAPAYAVKDAPPLILMYKDFGRNFEPPTFSTAEFLEAMRAIFRAVYGIQSPDASPFFSDLLSRTSTWSTLHFAR